jgi:hypothetical protein
VGVVVGGILVKFGMGFKLMTVLAHILIGLLLLGTSIFSYLVNHGHTEYSTPLVVCLTGIMFLFQVFMGSTQWPYIAAVILTDTGLSLASLTVWAGVLFMSTCTVYLFKGLTIPGTFMMFAVLTLGSTFVFWCWMKEIKGLRND